MKQVLLTVVSISLLLYSCQPAIGPDIEALQIEVEADIISPEPDATSATEEPASKPEQPELTPVTYQEVSMETYKDFSEYHFPEWLRGKTIDADGSIWQFSADGVSQPVNTLLYPNPIMPDTFNNAINGTTSESVQDSGEDFIYELSMSGKFEYKGNQYYGDVICNVIRSGGVLTVNGVEAVVVE